MFEEGSCFDIRFTWNQIASLTLVLDFDIPTDGSAFKQNEAVVILRLVSSTHISLKVRTDDIRNLAERLLLEESGSLVFCLEEIDQMKLEGNVLLLENNGNRLCGGGRI